MAAWKKWALVLGLGVLAWGLVSANGDGLPKDFPSLIRAMGGGR